LFRSPTKIINSIEQTQLPLSDRLLILSEGATGSEDLSPSLNQADRVIIF